MSKLKSDLKEVWLMICNKLIRMNMLDTITMTSHSDMICCIIDKNTDSLIPTLLSLPLKVAVAKMTFIDEAGHLEEPAVFGLMGARGV